MAILAIQPLSCGLHLLPQALIVQVLCLGWPGAPITPKLEGNRGGRHACCHLSGCRCRLEAAREEMVVPERPWGTSGRAGRRFFPCRRGNGRGSRLV
ncbi:hypothetical protein GGR56DRAFT_121256 [Xylariaceae sp. FL0804]|nr:hypothetical protein GGR56DRAFT_121256 [Xylariaceae sp. FL0804]